MESILSVPWRRWDRSWGILFVPRGTQDPSWSLFCLSLEGYGTDHGEFCLSLWGVNPSRSLFYLSLEGDGTYHWEFYLSLGGHRTHHGPYFVCPLGETGPIMRNFVCPLWDTGPIIEPILNVKATMHWYIVCLSNFRKKGWYLGRLFINTPSPNWYTMRTMPHLDVIEMYRLSFELCRLAVGFIHFFQVLKSLITSLSDDLLSLLWTLF